MACEKCNLEVGPCDDCKKAIHESWHKIGMWWIRAEFCSESCPGYLKDQERSTLQGLDVSSKS